MEKRRHNIVLCCLLQAASNRPRQGWPDGGDSPLLQA
jgi:hypothetical protein